MGVTNRQYRLYYNGVWKSYKNLQGALWDLLVLLHNADALELIDNGYFETTFLLTKNTQHVKRFSVETILPYSKFTIVKMTRGDLDKENFLEILEEVKELFYERI